MHIGDMIYEKNKAIWMNIREMEEQDRPREKLERKGPESLSDLELVMLLVSSGTLDRSVNEISGELLDLLEQKSLYWNDDLEIITTFVLKTIKQFSEEKGESQALLPMFKDDDDAEFAKELFRNTLVHGEEYRSYIENFIRNWEIERVAFMDIVIMMVAMSEFYKFPSIPTRVTLNEYIELAKSYSTSKSGQFVNGVLNAIADNLKKEGVLTKE